MKKRSDATPLIDAGKKVIVKNALRVKFAPETKAVIEVRQGIINLRGRTKNPAIVRNIAQFLEATSGAEPTNGHHAIAELSQRPTNNKPNGSKLTPSVH